MKVVIQRVKKATVTIDIKIIGQIGYGYLIFLGVEENDTEKDVVYLTKKISNLRIIADKAGKMNLSIKDINGSILLISQFTLCGETKGQNRPTFISAAKPEVAKELYELFIKQLKDLNIHTETGQFGGYMEVNLINDGPTTIIIDTKQIKL